MITVSLLILFILVAFSLLPLRYYLREKMMGNLAMEFGLRFYSKPPKFFDWYGKFLVFHTDWKINHIKGILANHQVYIYDVLFPTKVLFFSLNYYKRYTAVEIDRQNIKGKRVYNSFRLGDTYLTSIFELRRILKKLTT